MIPLDTLRGFSLFVGLNEAELQSLSIIAKEVSLQRGDFISKEDESAHMLFLLCDGWVDVWINTDSRDDHRALVTTLTAGDIIGWSAVVEPYVYTASSVCASPVKAIGFRGVDLRALFEVDHKLYCEIIGKICQVIANRLRATRLQMVSLFVAN